MAIRKILSRGPDAAMTVLVAMSLTLSACSKHEEATGADAVGTENQTETAAAKVDRCDSITGATFVGTSTLRSWFYGVEDGIESSVASRIEGRGGWHIEKTLDVGGKCFATARLSGMDEGNSYDILYRCPIKKLMRNDGGELLIEEADSGLCEKISSPTDPVRKDVSRIPSVDQLFASIGTPDVGPTPTASAPADATPQSVPSSYDETSAEPAPSTQASRTFAPIKVEPLGEPSEWVSADDYPPSASRQGQEGRVGYALEVSAYGKPTGCEVVKSSGTPALDDATCRVLIRRARFSPERDALGNNVPSQYTGFVGWHLPS